MRHASHRRTGIRSVAALLVAATAVAAAPVHAQSGALHPDCATQQVTADACQLAVDVFSVSTPLITSALAGGAPITDIGNGGQRFRLGLRVSAVNGFFPDLDGRDIETDGARSTIVATEEVPVPVPTVDLSVRLFPGVRLGLGPLGIGRVASVSALTSATYLPSIEGEEDFSVSTEGSGLKFGFGGRVGIVEDMPFLPDLAASFERRGLPTTSIMAATADDSLSLRDMSLSSQAIRVVASKKFLVFGLSAGWGQDRLDTEARLSAVVNDPDAPGGSASQTVTMSESITQSRLFAGLALGLGPLGIGAEIGQVRGDRPATYNTFDGADEESRLFGTVALRFAF